MATKFFIYYVGEEKESPRHSTHEYHPHQLSGGYDLLEKNIMEEKLKRLKETSCSDDVISPPSSPSRHEKWKLARTKPGGQMTSPQALEIAQHIIS